MIFSQSLRGAKRRSQNLHSTFKIGSDTQRARVEALVTNHLGDSIPGLEKYEVVQNIPMQEDRKSGGPQNFQLIYSLNSNYYGFLKPKFDLNILPTSRVYHNRSFIKPLISPHCNTQNHDMCQWHYWFQLEQNYTPALLKLRYPTNCQWGLHRE